MTPNRILLYLANSYLHGFKLQDPEYKMIIAYLRKDVIQGSHDNKKSQLISFLGEPTPLTSQIFYEILH